MAEPALTLTYRCTIDGLISLGTWSKIEQLGFEYEVTEYREGGVNNYIHKIVGPVKYDNLRLSRPIDQSSMMVAAWLAANLVKIVGQTMSVTALDSAGNDVTQWNFVNVVPVKWTGPSLDVNGNQVAMETLELAYDEMIGLGGVGAALAGAMTVTGNVRAGI
jgi:phage tail-like protein